MALKNFRPKFDSILAGEETIAIRGLNASDIAILIDAHWRMISDMFATFQQMEKGEDINARVDRLIIESVHKAPELVAGIIALSANEPDAVEQAKSLPFATQVDALVKVFTLTFEETGGLGNFLAVLRRAADAAKVALPTKTPPSLTPSIQ